MGNNPFVAATGGVVGGGGNVGNMGPPSLTSLGGGVGNMNNSQQQVCFIFYKKLIYLTFIPNRLLFKVCLFNFLLILTKCLQFTVFFRMKNILYFVQFFFI